MLTRTSRRVMRGAPWDPATCDAGPRLVNGAPARRPFKLQPSLRKGGPGEAGGWGWRDGRGRDRRAPRAYAQASLAHRQSARRVHPDPAVVPFLPGLSRLDGGAGGDVRPPPFQWLAFPVVDAQRFYGFDLYCAWEDVCVMALMFFLSGLFVAPSLKRKGAGRFAADRGLRLGAAVPVQRVRADAGRDLSGVSPPAAARRARRLPDRLSQPAVPAERADLVLCGCCSPSRSPSPCSTRSSRRARRRWPRSAADARRRPQRFLLALASAATLAYLPLTLRFGPVRLARERAFRVPAIRGRCSTASISSPASPVGAAGLGGGCSRATARLCGAGAGSRRCRR